jgi:hypothetical protein
MISKPVCAPDSVPSLRCTFHYKKGRTPEEVMPILLQRISSAALDVNAAKCAHAAHGAHQVLPMHTVPTAHTAFSDRQLLGCRAWAPLVCTKYCPKGKRGKRVPQDSSPSPFTTGWGKTHDIIGFARERDTYSPCPSPFLPFVPCGPACPSSSFPLAGQPLNPRGKPRRPARHH